MSVWSEVLTLGGGLVCLLAGGRAMLEGAINLATRVGVSPLLIGLTVVAWGTSAPELAFNSIAAAQGSTDLVFGNIVGANICNIGLILGVCGLVRPLPVGSLIVAREMPLMFGFMVLLPLLAAIPPNGGTLLPGAISRVEAGVLLGAFVTFSVFLVRAGLRPARTEAKLAVQVELAGEKPAGRPLWFAVILLAAGLALLAFGGDLAAEGAGGVARRLGVPETVIGVTIVAIGTTTPELVASLIAISRGQSDMAVGNIIGSCVFNLGCIYGVAGLIQPHRLPGAGMLPLATMLALGLLLTGAGLLINRRLHEVRIARTEGAVLLGVYGAFVGYQAWRALADRS